MSRWKERDALLEQRGCTQKCLLLFYVYLIILEMANLQFLRWWSVVLTVVVFYNYQIEYSDFDYTLNAATHRTDRHS